jgi:hypothetical protein
MAMVSTSTPAAPRLALTSWYASHTTRFAMQYGFAADFMSLIPAMPVGNSRQRDNAAPSLHPHYKSFNTTTGSSAPHSSIGILPHGVCHSSFPLTSRARFSRSIPKPVLRSCRLYTDCRRDRKQVSSRLILELRDGPSFDSVLKLFTMRHRTVHFRSSSQYVPAILKNDFSTVAHYHAF